MPIMMFQWNRKHSSGVSRSPVVVSFSFVFLCFFISFFLQHTSYFYVQNLLINERIFQMMDHISLFRIKIVICFKKLKLFESSEKNATQYFWGT